MPSWGWALLLKPFIGLLVLAVVFGIPMLIVKLLRPAFPRGRVKDFLFRERGGQRASRASDTRNGVLDSVTLVSREPRND